MKSGSINVLERSGPVQGLLYLDLTTACMVLEYKQVAKNEVS